MKPVQYWRLAVVLFWALLAISFFVDFSSAAPGSQDPSTVSSQTRNGNSNNNGENNNNNNRRGMRALREMRNLRRSHRSKFPLKAEDFRRKSKRTSECRLGKTVHEIGDTWNPDLGEPFGTMYCIQCACEPVQKKRRIVGRIRCKNVKSDCPKLDCNDAISLPGQCCKVCPEAYKNGTDKGNSDGFSEDDDKNDNNREYAALLTPRSSSMIKSSTGLGEPMSSGLGAGRFMFLHKSLYYSFVYNDGMPRPKFVQFVDSEGNVVEEQEVTINNYQQETRKICGVWRKMPRVYRKLLKEEKLHAALVTEKVGMDNDRFLAGKVAKQKYVSSEMYSSLLEPSTQVESGGMAVITVSPSTGSIYSNILFNGEFDEDRDIAITVKIADASGSGVEETVTIPKSSYDTNSIEVRSILELEQLQSLSRGTLFIVVYSKKNPDFKLIGFIQARTTCDIFDTVLETEDSQAIPGGLAWVYPLPDGSWSYNIQLAPEHQPQAVKLETGRKVLEDLSFKTLGSNMTRQIVSGMGPRHYQLLYEDNIYLSIITDKSNLRGRLSYRIFGDAQLSDAPMMLESNKNIPTNMRAQGLLWIGIDHDCGLNYQLTLNQRPQSDLMRLEIMETLGLSIKGLPVKSYILDNFEASEHEGIYNDFSKITYAHLNAGDAMFKIVRVNDSSLLASAVIRNVRVPTSCLPTTVDNIVSPDYSLDPSEDDASSTVPNSKCYYDGKLRDEYSQWTPVNDTCAICTCYKGQAKCEAVICPGLECANPVLLTGECCRSCLSTERSNMNRGQGCNVEGDRFHPAGSSWHPYMPPNGFMVCTTCTCRSDNLSVECTRQKCPALECAPEEAVYAQPLSCCKACPPKKAIDPDIINDAVAQYAEQTRGPSESEILAAGGCKFREELHENGAEWNHRIEPFGYIPCVSCTCLRGQTKCGRKKCPALACDVKVLVPGQCCQTCGVSSESPSIPLPRPSIISSKMSSSPHSRYRKPPSKHRTKAVLSQ